MFCIQILQLYMYTKLLLIYTAFHLTYNNLDKSIFNDLSAGLNCRFMHLCRKKSMLK